MKVLFVILILFYNTLAIFNYSYHGTTNKNNELKHDKSNTSFSCTTDFKPCEPNEGRRVDGSCNNLRAPTKGSGQTPFVRVLPAVFDKDYVPRKAASGYALPLARHIRTSLLADGRVPSQTFTQLAMHYLVYMSDDIVSQHDTIKYKAWRPYCCAEKGETDKDCAPNACGCIRKGTAPERIMSTTPLLDLSVLYGNSDKILRQKLRTFKGGLLKYDDVNGKIWPPATNTKNNVCFVNDKVFETRCHDTPDDSTNTHAGLNLVSIWFHRQHNMISGELAKVNPCWNDENLFDTARDINIAMALQIYYYEMMPLLLGKNNLETSGVITPFLGFRDLYNPNVLPQMSLEYPYILRWLHTLQESELKMYDTNGNYMKQIPIVNLTLRTGNFAVDDNIVYMTQGSFRQGSAAADHIVDPGIAKFGLGPHQSASDLTTNDLPKSRYFGFQPYIKYREFCFGEPIYNWNDLERMIDPERIKILRNTYEKIEDIDLMDGIWSERHIPGGSAPPTFYCIVVDQLIRNIVSDRHWYERPDRPMAFTFPQLIEIRKRTIAGMLCDVGDSVSQIQRDAFLRISSSNKIVDCSEISKFDYQAWKDPMCERPVLWNTFE